MKPSKNWTIMNISTWQPKVDYAYGNQTSDGTSTVEWRNSILYSGGSQNRTIVVMACHVWGGGTLTKARQN